MHVFRELLHTYSILVFTKLSTPAKYALSFLGFAFMKFCQDVKLSFAYHFRKYVKASRKEDTRAKNHKVDQTESSSLHSHTKKYTGGPPLTWFSLLRMPLPQFWGDFRVSKGPSTVLLTQILHNVVFFKSKIHIRQSAFIV